MPREPKCLYPSETELAKILLGERAGKWPEIARLEERHGLPRIDPVYGGRYWPAVKAFYDRRVRLIKEAPPEIDTSTEGERFDEIRSRRARPAKADAPQRSD